MNSSSIQSNRFKSYVIPPRAHLYLADYGNSYFCLTQQCLIDKEYKAFFQSRINAGQFVTNDSGVGDHDPIGYEDYINLIDEMRPSEAISLDVLYDCQQTKDYLDRFIVSFQARNLLGKVNIIFCAQGNNFKEWLDCYKYGLKEKCVDVMGMSKLSVPMALAKDKIYLEKYPDQSILSARHEMYDLLKEGSFITKPLHFLGAQDPAEFQKYLQDPLCRSNDSCYAVLAGYNEIDWTEGNFTRIPTPRNYFDLTLTDKQEQIAIKNIKYIQEVAHKSS